MRKLPKEVKELINHYFNLQINGKTVKSPYHINIKHVRGELRSLVGKGTPVEIEEEVMIFAKLRGFNLQKATKKEIREFMQSEGIGIDCSGFVSHILNTWLKAEKEGRLWSKISFEKLPLLVRLTLPVRAIENINVKLLTNEKNSDIVKLKDIQIGDLIKLKGLREGEHVAIVIDVQGNEVTYVHSSKHYGDENGVREGKILIKDVTKGLEKQEWLEKDAKGVCWTLKQYEKDLKENGIRRPKFFVK